MKKCILSLHYHVEGKWYLRPDVWSQFPTSSAKSLRGGKRQLGRLQKEYATYKFRLIETRAKIVG